MTLSKKAVERLDFRSTEKVLCYNKWGKKTHDAHILIGYQTNILPWKLSTIL